MGAKKKKPSAPAKSAPAKKGAPAKKVAKTGAKRGSTKTSAKSGKAKTAGKTLKLDRESVYAFYIDGKNAHFGKFGPKSFVREPTLSFPDGMTAKSGMPAGRCVSVIVTEPP